MRNQILLGVAASLLAIQAYATSFTVGDIKQNLLYNTYWQAGAEPKPIEPFYKDNFGGDEEGQWAPKFSTSWQPPEGEDGATESATITWEKGFHFELTEIWIKAATGEWFAVDVSGFDSDSFDSIVLYNPFLFIEGENLHAISHVTLFGNNVPDGGVTALMLGLGVLGVGYMARRKS